MTELSLGTKSSPASPKDTWVKLCWDANNQCLECKGGTRGSPEVLVDLQEDPGLDVEQISLDANELHDTFHNALSLKWENASALPAAIHQLPQLTSLRLISCRCCDLGFIGQLPELRNLDLDCDHLYHPPDTFSQLSQLTSLRITNCSSLDEFPEAISSLSRLVDLHLKDSNIKVLPTSITQLSQLSGLSLIEWRSLKRSEQFSQLSQLKSLNLMGCRSLEALPEDLHQVSQLADLQLQGCCSLKRLPRCIGDLTQLTDLCLYGCSALEELPPSIGKLRKLTGLDLAGCSDLEALPESIGGLLLQSLVLTNCRSLNALPKAITQLSGLTHLDISGCRLTISYHLDRLQGRFKVVFTTQMGRRWEGTLDKAKEEVHRGRVNARRDRAKQALLSDRDARHRMLESVAVIAVLWATAAFICFAEHPNMPDVFVKMLVEGEEDHDEVKANEQEKAELWLRFFFIASEVTFYSSVAVVLLYLVSSLPHTTPCDKDVAVVRVWLGYVGLSLLLFVAVMSGIFAFVAAGLVANPGKQGWDVLGPWIIAAGLLGVPVFYQWFTALKCLWPGWTAISMWCGSWEVVPEVPLQGSDESAYQTLEATKELVREVKQLGKQLSGLERILEQIEKRGTTG